MSVKAERSAMPGTILVVEDELPLLKLAMLVLPQWGYQVLSAETGQQAMQAWRDHQAPIDLLFADVFLPDMTGIELAAALATLQPGLKAVYTTGSDRSQVDALFAVPTDIRLLKKPASLGQLKTFLQDALVV
jgi:two-component system cell cycle sensor histidine kinase/response regulator CckA